jgi:hypothetical protein
MRTTFYMVLVDWKNTTTVKHNTLKGAENEAKRLTKKENREVFILKWIKSYKTAWFMVEDFEENEEIEKYIEDEMEKK